MSISSEIERLQKAKKDIGDAIVRKGGSVSGTLDTYAKSVMALGDVSFRTAIDIVNKSDAKNVDLTMISPRNETNLIELFYNNDKLVSVDVSNWDTSNITSLRTLFGTCPSLVSVDASNWDTSNVTSFYAMLDACFSLKTFDTSKWVTSSATTMAWMFNGVGLEELDVSNFNTSKVTNMYAMFSGVRAMVKLDVSNFDTSNVLDAGRMFSYWNNECEELDISGLNLSNATSMDLTFFGTSFKVIRSDELQLPDIDMKTIGLNGSKELTVDSIVGLLNALPHSDKGYSFQIGADNIAKLTDEQKAIATNKGWTLI